MRYLILIAFMFGMCKAQIPAGILSQKTGNDIYFITFSSDSLDIQYPTSPLWAGKETTIVFDGIHGDIVEEVEPGVAEFAYQQGFYTQGIDANPDPLTWGLGATGVHVELFDTGDYVEWAIYQGGLTPNKLTRVLNIITNNGLALDLVASTSKTIKLHLYANLDDNLVQLVPPFAATSFITYVDETQPEFWVDLIIPSSNLHNNPFTLDPYNPSGGWVSSPEFSLIDDGGVGYINRILISPANSSSQVNVITAIGIEIIP